MSEPKPQPRVIPRSESTFEQKAVSNSQSDFERFFLQKEPLNVRQRISISKAFERKKDSWVLFCTRVAALKEDSGWLPDEVHSLNTVIEYLDRLCQTGFNRNDFYNALSTTDDSYCLELIQTLYKAYA